jgi:putative PIG3 family NAD(P)H quinone oxidoreductase
MQAVLLHNVGGAEQLYIGDAPTPIPKPHEVLIKVHACGINRADILQRKGHYPPPAGESNILGLEVAGQIVELGSKCTSTHVGQKVFALLAGGGYAQYACIPESLLMPIPDNLTFVEAAAIAEVFLTAYQALFWLGKLNKGETLLIHAGAGGVGTAAIQIAKQINANIIVTTSSLEKINACKNLGAHYGINYKEHDFSDAARVITNNQGVDIIIDSIGAPYLKQNLSALREDGRLVMLALQGGSKVTELTIASIIGKRLTLLGSTLRNRSLDYKARLTDEFTRTFLPLFESGELKPVIAQVFDWREVQKAHELLESNTTVGKVILKVEH